MTSAADENTISRGATSADDAAIWKSCWKTASPRSTQTASISFCRRRHVLTHAKISVSRCADKDNYDVEKRDGKAENAAQFEPLIFHTHYLTQKAARHDEQRRTLSKASVAVRANSHC